MKPLIVSIIILVSIYSALSAQSLSIGNQLNDFELIDAISGEAIRKADFADKAIIFDFWATWCSPCIAAMPKLETLRNKYANDLVVIMISHSDKQSRIQRFKEHKNYDFIFAMDNENRLGEQFPYRILSHLVWVDKKGNIKAITDTGAINEQAVLQLINGQDLNLPVKVDLVDFNPAKDYFNQNPTTVESFEIQPAIANAPTYARMPNNKYFDGRRMTMYNFVIPGFYREAYQISSFRTVILIDETEFAYKKENQYCLDLIVAEKDKTRIHEILREKLETSFDIKTRLEKQLRDVITLYRLEDSNVQLKSVNKSDENTARGDSFFSKGTSMDDFSGYFEDFGIVGNAVVNDTGLTGFYEIDFSFDPENPDSFHKSLSAMGLGMKKAEKEIEVLVIYRD